METNPEKFFLPFESFSLVLLTNLELSVETTQDFIGRGVKDFVYAVGSVDVAWDSTKYNRVIELESASNLLQFLSELEKRIASESKLDDLAEALAGRSWCAAANAYWKKTLMDTATPQDEQMFDRLTHAVVLSGRFGEIVMYKATNQLYLEVCMKGAELGEAQGLIARLQKDVEVQRIRQLASQIETWISPKLAVNGVAN